MEPKWGQTTRAIRLARTRGDFHLSVIVALLTGVTSAAVGQEFTPFIIPARISPRQVIWVADHQPIKTDSERLSAAPAGRFYCGGAPVRIWGVNTCFGANFPTHEDAPYVAQRLAAAGVNSVRCHHLDTSRWPNGIWNAADGKTIEPQALDRLDYFINELAQRSIRVNLNLHVGRTHSRYLGLPATNSEYDKISGIFTPALVEAQKQYARDLLTHVNPYRQMRYADDPAVAFVEITNEDSFFMWGAEQTLRTLPLYYADILRGQFNSWLRQRYGSDDALRAAWARDTRPPGQEMLQNGTFLAWDKKRSLPEHWNLEQHEGCQASLSFRRGLPHDSMQVDITQADATEWHLQLTQGNLPVTAGQYYTVSFEASSRESRAISCNVGQAHDPWSNLGLSRRVELSPQGKKFTFGFVATASDTNARVSFAFSGSSTPFNLARVEMHPGGQVGLAEGESLSANNVSLFQESESMPRILDRMVFLAETEKAYFDGMRSYIKNDLGCGALVTGTIVFGPLGLYAQSDMDYIDSHAYWQHPTFPDRPWDPANWLIEQRPMTDHPDEATLFRIAAERLSGKPFTLSEYNHPAPLDAQAECVPMIASFAAAQDWDGVWLFDYSGSANAWSRENMSGFFDIDTNPAKWGFVRAGAAIFGGGLRTGEGGSAPAAMSDATAIAKLDLKYDGNMLRMLTDMGGLAYSDILRTRILGWRMSDSGFALQSAPISPQSEIQNLQSGWSVDAAGRGLYQAISPQIQVYTGHASRFEEATGGKICIASPEFVALTVTPLDAKTQTQDSAPLLVTACGRCENTGMQFTPDRRTVGRNWGTAPVQIEAVQGSLAVPEGKWLCYALAPDGSQKQLVPVAYEDGRGTLTLSPQYKTMWYLLERQTR